jgi:hypothetical protein
MADRASRGGGRGRCAACSHPQLSSLEAELAAGTSLRRVAVRYGVSKTSLQRHLAAHSNPALIAMAKARAAGDKPGQSDTASLAEQLRLLIQRARTFLYVAEAAGNLPAGLAAIREVRQTLELLGRATGELTDRPSLVINLVATPEWLAIRTTILQVLARHPQAQLEVADALAAHESAP